MVTGVVVPPARPKRRKGDGGKHQTVSASALNRLAAAMSADTADTLDKHQPFKPYTMPPGVGHNSGGAGEQLAMDEAWGGSEAWATQGVMSMAYLEGQTFLGYPQLAILAQRAEYRAIAEIVANEMTRKWIEFKTKGPGDAKADKIKQIEDYLKKLGARDAFRRAAELDSFFGRAHIFPEFSTEKDEAEDQSDLGNGRDDISRSKVSTKNPLRALRVIEPVWVSATAYETTDPTSPNWYKPEQWMLMTRRVHRSRLFTFIGREVPDLLKPAYAFGGLSMSQMAKPYVDNWLRTRQAVSDLIASFAVSGIKTDLAKLLEGDGEGTYALNRIKAFVATRSNKGVALLDKTDEDFFTVTTPLGTLDKLQAQSLEQICSVTRIPLVKYTGITPSGLNASSEGEIESFDDWIADYQEALYRDPLEALVGFVQLSLFDEIDPDIEFDFVPLRQMSEIEKADIRQKQAATDQILVQTGAIGKDEVRTRVIADKDSGYEALDPTKLPAPAPGDQASIANAYAGALGALVDGNIITVAMAMQQLRALAPLTGMLAGIKDEDIIEAANNPPMPGPEDMGPFPPPEGGGGFPSAGGMPGAPEDETGANMPPGDAGAMDAAADGDVTLSLPLFIRLLEFARESAGGDEILHEIAERMKGGRALTMADYAELVGEEGAAKESATE